MTQNCSHLCNNNFKLPFSSKNKCKNVVRFYERHDEMFIFLCLEDNVNNYREENETYIFRRPQKDFKTNFSGKFPILHKMTCTNYKPLYFLVLQNIH